MKLAKGREPNMKVEMNQYFSYVKFQMLEYFSLFIAVHKDEAYTHYFTHLDTLKFYIRCLAKV